MNADDDISKADRLLTVPNVLSFYRLCAAPVILALVLAGNRELFAVFLLISLLSDVLDGLIARFWRQATRFGARLDSLADSLTFIVAVVGVWVFERETLRPDLPWVYAFLVFYVLSDLVPYIRFGKLSAFHLYSFRASGYLMAANFVMIFTIGYVSGFFIFTMIFASLACLEIVAVSLLLDEFRTDQRGLYWVLQEQRRRRRAP